MKKNSFMSLAMKRLFPFILSVLLLFANFDALQVQAGEGDGNTPPIEEPEENLDEGDDEDEENSEEPEDGEDKDSNIPPTTPENGGENGDEKADEDQPNADDPEAGNPTNGEDGSLIIDPNLSKNIQGQNMLFGSAAPNGMGEPTDPEEPEQGAEPVKERSITITFMITDDNNNSGFKINGGSIDPNGGTITIFNNEISDHKDEETQKTTLSIDDRSFSYSLNQFYALEDVTISGDGEISKGGNNITYSFKDIEEPEDTTQGFSCTISGTVVKTDNDAPDIGSVHVAKAATEDSKGTPSYTCTETGKTFFSTNASDLEVTVEVTDKDEDGEEESGVASVEINVNGELQPMNKDGEVYKWTPSAPGNYTIGNIVAKDNAENSVEKTVDQQTLCLYPSNEANNLTLNISAEDWHSVSLNGDVALKLDGFTYRKIKKIIVSDSENTVEEVTDITDALSAPFGGKQFAVHQSIDLPPDKEGETEYNVKVVFEGDDEGQAINVKKTAKIDNTAPTGDVEVEPELVTEHGQINLGFMTIENPWVTRTSTNVYIKVPKNCDDKEGVDAVSGFFSVTYKLADGQVFTKNIQTDLDYSKTNNDYYVFKQLIDGEGENVCRLTVLSIADKAGNKFDLSENNEIEIYIDGTAPVISYEINSIKAEDGERLFFAGELSGKVKVSDLTLKSVEFTQESIEGYKMLIPELIQKKEVIGEPIEHIYAFSTSEDGEYLIETIAHDALNNENEGNVPRRARSRVMILDNTAPEIEISYDKDAPSEGGDSVYNSNVGISVKITDKWLDKTKSFVKIKKVDQFGATTELGPFNDFSGELGDEEHTFSFTTDGDGEYIVYVEAYDMSGNHSEKTGSKFLVDATTPEVTISFDKNDPMNGKYYNETRTATVTVTDFTFYEEGAGLKVEEKYGTADISGWSQTGPFTYTCTVTFEKDGIYELSCQSEDKAHNKSEEKSEPEFVIDKTAPQIQVNYNGAIAANGNFYKDTRIASVNIKEMSFDDKLVEITTQPLNEVGTLPAVGGFSSSDDQNIASITFDEDGTYGYVVNCTDLAGNKAENYISDVFIIDKTVPEVTFSGVEDHSANNAEVAPGVKYGDKYIDLDRSSVVLRGANNGIITVGSSITPTEDGFMVNYSDFAHDKSMDDLYTLEAIVYDKAGNEAKEQLVFSVNRHGSVFVITRGTQDLNDRFYINEPTDVTIQEINIDDIVEKKVAVSRDGDIIPLKSGSGYTVSQQGSGESWKTYTYTIPRKEFLKDGHYSVSISTVDRATNVQDNKTRDAEINFAVDMTAPSIVTAGIEEGGEYKDTSHTFNIDVNDNMGVDNLVVYLDGKVVGTYDQQAIENGENMSLTLNESENTQTVTMIAEDYAGNKEVSVISGILVSTKTQVKGVGGGTGLGGRTEHSGPITLRTVFFIILAGASVGSVAGASVLLYRRKIK